MLTYRYPFGLGREGEYFYKLPMRFDVHELQVRKP
jgi:hypothetical protein